MRGSSISRLRSDGADPRHLRRDLQQVRQQPPRQRPLAVELARRGGLQLLELRPRSSTAALSLRRRLLLLQGLLRLQQARVAWCPRGSGRTSPSSAGSSRRPRGPGRRRSRWSSNCGRPARPKIWWAVLASISFCLPSGPFTSDVSTTERAGRLMPDASVSVQTHDRQQLALEQVLDDPAILRQQAGVMDADAAVQHLLQLRADALRPVELVDLGVQQRPSAASASSGKPLELLGDAPALVAVEAEDQGRRLARCRRRPWPSRRAAR